MTTWGRSGVTPSALNDGFSWRVRKLMRSSVKFAPPPRRPDGHQRADKYSRWPGTWLIREENNWKIVSQHAAHARDALGAARPFRVQDRGRDAHYWAPPAQIR